MREQEFKARDKKVQKMTRDGLTEKNLTQGTEQRISQRLADVSFEKAKPEEQAAGHRAQSRTQRKQQQQKQGAKPQDFQPSEDAEEVDRFAEATAPEVWGPDNAPAAMRDAGDKPVLKNRPPGGQPEQAGRGKKRRPPVKPARPAREADELDSADSPSPVQDRPDRLRFHAEDSQEQPKKGGKSVQRGTRYQAKFKPSEMEKPVEPDAPSPEVPAGGRLRFTHEDAPEPATGERAASKKRQATRFAADTAGPKDAPRLRFERGELPLEERAAADTGADAEHTTGQASDKSRQQKKYEKAQHRVHTADRKLEKAQAKLPTRRRARLEKQYDSEVGKVKRRLRFERELIPENEKPPLLKRAGKALGRATSTAVIMKAHQKIREVEHDNVAIEATHKVEFAGERAAGRFLRWNKRRVHSKPYRAVRRAEQRVTRANADMAYRQLLKDNPELQKKALKKWIQKQQIKRKYAAAAREAAKGVKHTQNVLTATGQIIRAVAQAIGAHKAVLGIVALVVLVVVLFGSMFSSCTAMLSGVQSAVISTCYVADDKEINDSELCYTELETDLQKDIDDTEENHPGFDEYRYNIGEIGHNPYELMGYLSAAYDAFTFSQVRAELDRLFNLQYTLIREEIVEIRTYTDEDGDEHEYEWYVLQTTLTVRPLADIIAGSLAPGDQTDRYGVYMQTYGNRQSYGNPFDFPWLGYVTSPYGYRIHPISGEKNLHRGMDIGVASGTPIKAIQDGRVVSAGNAGDYGLCVVIEGEDGYQSRYAHCSSISVSAGQEVKRGDVIAAVGSTGNSTGPHLHLEVTHNGEYLNPYYFVDNGGDGYTPGGGAAGGPHIPDDPGSPMGDGTWEAMLAEAERYLGYPYVWGGSSPSTSFDCSGFVSWVINHSGVGNVGRLGAQGLFNITTPVSRQNAKPGDLIFFTGTYSCSTPVSHVGIYVGGGRMIHCGDPISYANIDSNYWTQHFYSFGRLSGMGG